MRRGAAVRGALRGAGLGHRAAARAGRPLRVRQQRAGVRQRRQHLRQPVPAARSQPPLREVAPAAGHRPAARRLRPRYPRAPSSPVPPSRLRPLPTGGPGERRGGEPSRGVQGSRLLGKVGTGPRGGAFRGPPGNPALRPARGRFRARRVPRALSPAAPGRTDGASGPVAGCWVPRGAPQRAREQGQTRQECARRVDWDWERCLVPEALGLLGLISVALSSPCFPGFPPCSLPAPVELTVRSLMDPAGENFPT